MTFWVCELRRVSSNAHTSRMSSKIVVLKTDTQLRQFFVKGFILGMPYWLIVGGVQFCGFLFALRSGTWFSAHDFWQILAVAAFVFCSIGSIILTQNKLAIGNDLIKLPWPACTTINLREIKEVELESKRGVKFLNFEKVDGKIEPFPLSCLNEGQKDTLLSALRERCGIAVVPDALSWEQDFLSEDASGEYRIKYQVTTRLKNFTAAFKEIDKLFWKLWMYVCLFPVVVALPALPYLVTLLISGQTRYSMQPAAPYVEDFYRIFFQFTNACVVTFGASTKSYFDSMQHPFFIFVASLLLFLLAFMGIAHLLQPNLLKLTNKGIELCYEIFGSELTLHMVHWTDIKGFSLVKPGDTTDSAKWYIEVEYKTANCGRLNYSSLSNESDRLKFMKAVKKFAPHTTIAPELVQSFSSTNKRSYTELWLQTLSAPASRKNFVPLAEGALLLDGRYRVQDALGVGGQGIAYLAQDTFAGLGSNVEDTATVVLKEFVMPVHAESGIRLQALERFNREAQILQTLEHPGVVKIRDYFVEDHRGYLVLEHIDGSSLRRAVQGGYKYTPTELISLVEQMCEMLRYLTSLTPQIVHRDFTPDNLLVGKDGILKLIDFNVAHQRQGSSTATVVGKHAYLPPEQFRGQPTTKSDIYALGCTLYFLVKGCDPEPLTQSSLEEASTGWSRQISNIIFKCTALDENDRIGSVDEILQLLAEVSPDEEGDGANFDGSSCRMEPGTDSKDMGAGAHLIERIPESTPEKLEERHSVKVSQGA